MHRGVCQGGEAMIRTRVLGIALALVFVACTAGPDAYDPDWGGDEALEGVIHTVRFDIIREYSKHPAHHALDLGVLA